ncbi:hypothetical protein [Paenibacillus sp. L3-i20]|uniref:hypothetical protein n=1 Tax=Paenibacillus sp. L3-i20 TaxID=2905833 RepID=UPI001EDFE6F2|nr:hypothetical protein [Paenibacillus sp. L3-i20]GKU77579.1 hypothetical protein L3i20_v219760 [Paenibacillus sp. L3-i20]
MSVELELPVEKKADEVQELIAAIVHELTSLHALAARMKTVYAGAAERNDLTFIKIIEEKYEDMLVILQQLTSRVVEEQNSIALQLVEGGNESGREEPSFGSDFAKRAIS